MGLLGLAEPVPGPVAAPVRTSKADIYRRATEGEANQLADLLMNAPARMAGIFAGSQYLDHADADFADLLAVMTMTFGADRAVELLAPSTF